MKDVDKQYIHPTRIFKGEADFWNAWEGYKKDLDQRAEKWEKIQYVGKDGERRSDKPKMPILIRGFYRYCLDNGIGTVHQYFENKDGLYEDFVGVVSRARYESEEDITTGGLLQQYSPNFSARITGHGDKQEITEKVIKIEGLPKDLDKDLDED